MQELKEKKVCESVTQQVQIIMPADINGDDRLFGGRLMEWIDVVAAVVARRHSGYSVTTAAVDHLRFKSAAYVNDTVVLKGMITYVGKTSMEVRVDTFVEELSGEQKMINRAYLVLVAIDLEGNPTVVPRLLVETQEEKDEWEAAKLRNQYRKSSR